MYTVPKIKKIYIYKYVDLPRHLESKTATKLKIPERNHQIIIHRLICIANRAIYNTIITFFILNSNLDEILQFIS